MKIDSRHILEFLRKLYKTDLEPGYNLLSLSVYNEVSMWWTSDVLLFNSISKNLDDVKKSILKKNY